MFLQAYKNDGVYAIECESPDVPFDTPMVSEELTEGQHTVLVNYRGLAVITYKSVVTYESSLFGSPFRGYLIMFQYTLYNGPVDIQLMVPNVPRMYDYTAKHMVSETGAFDYK